MAKNQSVTIGEYIVEIDGQSKVQVYRISKSTLAELKQCADEKGFAYSDTVNTQTLGKNLLKEFCEGASSGVVGEVFIERAENGHIDAYRTYDNTKGALRDISDAIGFEYDGSWTTQQFGAKLVKHAQENGPFQPKTKKENNETECETDNNELKDMNVHTIVVGGRAEVYRTEAVADPDSFNADDANLENTSVEELEADGITVEDTMFEYALLYKVTSIDVDGETVFDPNADDNAIDEDNLTDFETSCWFGNVEAFQSPRIVSVMNNSLYVEQTFKVILQDDEEFDPGKIQLINLYDDYGVYPITEQGTQGTIAVGYILYDGMPIEAVDNPLDEGYEVDFGGSYYTDEVSESGERICYGSDFGVDYVDGAAIYDPGVVEALESDEE